MDYFVRNSYLLSFGVFIPFIFLLLRRKPLWSQSSTSLFSAYIILDVIAWFLSFYLSANGKNTFLVSNIYTVGEFLILSLFFINILEIKKVKLFRILSLILSAIFGIFVFIGSNNTYNNFTEVFSNLLFIILSLIFYYKIMKEHKIENLLAYPHFYFNTGILLYFSCSIFIVIFSNYFLELSEMSQMYLWTFHSIINFICYLIFAVGFFKCRLKAKY